MLLGSAWSITRLASCPQPFPARDFLPRQTSACRQKALVPAKQRRSRVTRGHRAICTAQLQAADLPVSRNPHKPAKLAVFVSGGGSNFRAIHDAILTGYVQAHISVRMLLRYGGLAELGIRATDEAVLSDRPL